MVRILVIILLLGWPSSVAAQEQCSKQIYTDSEKEPNYDCPSPGERSFIPTLSMLPSAELVVKAPAPWSGILMDKNRVLTLGFRIQALRRIRWHETVGFKELMEAEKKYIVERYEMDLNLCAEKREEMKRQILVMQKEVERTTKWYYSGPFWFSIGVTSAITGVLAAAFISD